MRRLSQALRRPSRAASSAGTALEEEGDYDPDPMVAKQKKTFRRWVNSHLAARKMEVKDIIKDWDDGIMLVALMEILATTDLGKINTKPKMKLHNLENLNKVLKFIGTHVKLVNIGSEDIYTHNQTIVLGLIWTLILRWGVKLDSGKQGLLDWVNSKVKDLGGPLVTNFDKDWQNGMKFAALVHVIDPEFDFASCSPDDPLGSMDRAFLNADANLDIPVLLDPADVMNSPDEKSVMTYVGMFFKEFGNRDDIRIQRVKPVKPVVSNCTATTADVSFEIPEGVKAVKIKVVDAAGASISEKEYPSESEERSFTLSELTPDTQFSCTATVVQPNDKEVTSEPTEFSTSKVGAPPAPKVSGETESSIDVEIEPVEGAESYTIEVASPASGKNFDRVIPLEAGQTKLTVDSLAPGTAHAFRVASVSSTGTPSDPSAPTVGCTKLHTPSDARVEDITDSEANVIIDPSSTIPVGTRYKVQILDPEESKGGWNDNDFNQEGSVTASESGPTEYGIDELEPSHTYQARVIAISPDGVESQPSNPVEFTTTEDKVKQTTALVTGGNTPKGLQMVVDICDVDSKFGRYDTVFVCVREGGDARCSVELKEMAERSQQPDHSGPVIHLINYDKKNSESVKEAAKALKASKIHLIVNNAKLRRDQLSVLIGNQ